MDGKRKTMECPGCRARDRRIADLERQIADLNQTISAQAETISAQAEEIAALRDQVSQLVERREEQERNSKRQTSRFPRRKRKNPDEHKRLGRKDGHDAAHRARPDKVDRVAPVPAESCPDCGGNVVDKTVHEQFQIDIPPVEPTVTRFDIEVGRCACCGKRVQGRHADQTSDALGAAAVQLGPRLLGLSAWLHYRLGVSFRKTSELFEAAFGVNVSPGGLARACARIAARAGPTYEELIRELREDGVVHADETGWRDHRKSGGARTESAWLWVFSSQETTIYVIRESRGHEVVEEVMGPDFNAPLVCDGFSAYDATDYLTARCNAHPLRRIAALEEDLRGEALESLLELKAIWAEAFDIRDRRDEMTERGHLRRAAEVQNEFFAWIEFHTEDPDAEVGKLARHLDKHRYNWFLHLFDEDVPATNNHAERMIRPAVIGRKLGACNRTEKGAGVYEVPASLSVTLAQRGRDFLAFVTQLLHQPHPEIIEVTAQPIE